ncbi:uncharacterized protein [Paralichthys olivaceus]|uniref:uncharacterized protein n=1 Tax=Paralichthys olivaceus TaxID=8255 RepID=UPI0037531D8D
MGRTLLCVLRLFLLNIFLRCGHAEDAVLTIEPQWSPLFAGESVTFTCDMRDGQHTDWFYRLLKDGHEFVRYSIMRSWKIKLTTADSGKYQCAGQRPQSEIEKKSNEPSLTVSEKPRPDLTVTTSWPSPGASVTLSCSFKYPSAGWRFLWFKTVYTGPEKWSYDYKFLPGSTNGTIIVYDQTHTAYFCSAKRGDPVYHSLSSDPKFVWSRDLHSAPSLTVNPDRVQHFRSEPVSLSCEGNSTEFRFFYFNNGIHQLLCPVSRTGNGSMCTVYNLWGSKVYWCGSGSGQFSSTVNITVVSADIILESPVHPVAEGTSVTLGCRPRTENDPSDVLFYKNDQLIQNDRRQELTIPEASQAHEGFYKCGRSGRTSAQSWMSVGPASRPESSSFPLPLILGLVGGIFLLLLLLLLFCVRKSKDSSSIRSQRTNQSAAAHHMIDQDETQGNNYASLVHDEPRDGIYSLIELEKLDGNGEKNKPEESCVYSDVRIRSAAGESTAAVTDETIYSEVKPSTSHGFPFEHIGMDLIGPFHQSARGYRFVPVLVDCATRYPEPVPLRTVSAESVAQALFQVIFGVGIPKEILTDQGTSFMSRTLRELYGLLGIKSIRTSVYHPQTDGLVKRLNKTLKTMIRKFIHEDDSNWDKWRDPLSFAVWEVPQASKGFSPFQLLFGRKPRGVPDLKENWEEGPSPSKNKIQYVLDLRAKLHTLGQLSRMNMLQAQARQHHLYNRGARLRRFTPGEKVLVLLPSSSSKLLTKWQGPFVVTRRVGEVDYEVARSDRSGATQLYHLNLLKAWREAESVSLVSHINERDELGPEVPKSINPASLPCDNHLSSTQRAAIATLQHQFADVFSPLPGRTTLIQHHVETFPGASIRLRPFRLPEHKRKVFQKELAAMPEMGMIEESNSARCSPIVLVAKKDGATRFCVDYRKVNDVSRFDAYPMPRVNELLDRLANFQQLMDQVLLPHAVYAAAYLDDVIIHSDTWAEHVEGACPQPKSKKEVRRFVVLAGYCGRFIPAFVDLTSPLTDLTRKVSVSARMVGGVDTLRYYLLGRSFTLCSDHAPLQWLHRMKDANARITRCFVSAQSRAVRMGRTLLCVLRLFLLNTFLCCGHAEDAVLTIEPQWSPLFARESVTFTCDMRGGQHTDWFYRLLKDGHEIVPYSRMRSYKIQLTTDDSGKFQCAGVRRQSEIEKKSNELSLTVSEKPRPDLTVTTSWPGPGASVTLSCSFKYPSAGWRFLWFKFVYTGPEKWSYDYKFLPGSTNGTIIVYDQTYTGYFCRAERGDPVYQSLSSDPKFVWSRDLHSAPSLTVNPDRVQHFSSEPVSLSCEGNSTEFRFFYFDEIIHLLPCPVRRTGTGSMCTVYNLNGSAVFWCGSGSGQFSNAVNITVVSADIILESPVHPVAEGTSVTLGCRPRTENDPSDVLFYKNDQLIQNDRRQELTIPEASQAHEGFYKCGRSGRTSAQSWMSVGPASRPESSSFPLPLILGLVGGITLILLLSLLLLCWSRTSKSSEQTVDQDENQEPVYSSLLHGDNCIYESIRGSEDTEQGTRGDPEETPDYVNADQCSATGTNMNN